METHPPAQAASDPRGQVKRHPAHPRLMLDAATLSVEHSSDLGIGDPWKYRGYISIFMQRMKVPPLMDV